MGHYFYMLAGGNAVNFLHGASVGAFIFLVQAEILAATSRLTAGDCEPGYHEVPAAAGHVTCSAIVLDPDRHVLHIRHNTLHAWLRPGGHLEPGDTSLIEAALREVSEETGIRADALALISDEPVDIDVHPIPANPAKGEPDHQHFDLRYAFTTAARPVIRLQAEEVDDFAWLPAADIQPAALAERIAANTLA